MTLKAGDVVVVTGSDRALREHMCDRRIVTGGTYEIEISYEGGAYLKDCGHAGHVRAEWLELADEYSDEDWV